MNFRKASNQGCRGEVKNDAGIRDDISRLMEILDRHFPARGLQAVANGNTSPQVKRTVAMQVEMESDCNQLQ